MKFTAIPRAQTSKSLLVALLAATGMIVAGSLATPARATNIDAALDHACHDTMGFGRSTIEYHDCVRSDTKVKVAAAGQAETEQDWQACSHQGLQPGTSAYAMCVLKLQQSATNH